MNIKKQEKMHRLSEQRRLDTQKGMSKVYKQVGDFHGGIYDEWKLVSPWSKSANNLDSQIMVVAQDWTSEEATKKPLKHFELGHDPDLPTNKNLKMLLTENFGVSFSEIYATNLFVFVKPGNLSSKIPIGDLIYSAKKYTLEEIKIVQPKVVICLGSATFHSLCKAIDVKPPSFQFSSENPINYDGCLIFGVPHTGGLGTMNAGGMANVRKIWRKMIEHLK